MRMSIFIESISFVVRLPNRMDGSQLNACRIWSTSSGEFWGKIAIDWPTSIRVCGIDLLNESVTSSTNLLSGPSLLQIVLDDVTEAV